jgi:uncharacterized membrane protein YbaN (DUF454 family)
MMIRLRDLGIECCGWVLLALAVVFVPLPIVPTLLLLAALLILSSRYSWASRLLEKARGYLPAFLRKTVVNPDLAANHVSS